jgi:hypothetical protein
MIADQNRLFAVKSIIDYVNAVRIRKQEYGSRV